MRILGITISRRDLEAELIDMTAQYGVERQLSCRRLAQRIKLNSRVRDLERELATFRTKEDVAEDFVNWYDHIRGGADVPHFWRVTDEDAPLSELVDWPKRD